MDARTALDFLSLRHDVNHKEIIVFGRSLGKVVQMIPLSLKTLRKFSFVRS
jgi:hypothetical protein